MFGKRKKEKVSFGEWLNGILSNFTLDAAAFNFNIYENKKDYSAELVATASFDEDDEDWACEIFKKRRQRNYPQRRYIGCFSRRFDYYFDYAPAGEVSIKNLRRRAGIR